jgi:hypothetical protein
MPYQRDGEQITQWGLAELHGAGLLPSACGLVKGKVKAEWEGISDRDSQYSNGSLRWWILDVLNLRVPVKEALLVSLLSSSGRKKTQRFCRSVGLTS